MATSLSPGGPTRILVFIEQPAITEVVKLTLNHGVYETREVNDPYEAMALIGEWQPHLAVLEVEFAGNRLLDLMGRASKGQGGRIPVLALTRRDDLKTKLTAFEHGVDDIMTVPFSPEELRSRALAITRRVYGHSVSVTPVLRLGELEIDILNRHVRIHGEVLHLTALEQSLLYFLAANAGKLLTRDAIVDAIWSPDFAADSNIVDRHMSNLRVKLQNGSRNLRYVATVPGQGYRFTPLSTDPGTTT